MEMTVAGVLTWLWLFSSVYFYRQSQSKMPKADTLTANMPASTLVLYASQSGQAQQVAEQLYQQLAAAAPDAGHTELACMSALDIDTLVHYQRVLVIASTYGAGEPPDSARRFVQRLKHTAHQALVEHDCGFAVLALGDRSYTHFCAFGNYLEAELSRVGMRPLWPQVQVDKLAPKDLSRWQLQLSQHFDVQPTSSQSNTLTARLLHREVLNPGSPNPALCLVSLQLQAPLHAVQAGDIVDIQINATERRSYSVANAPHSIPGGETNASTQVDLIVRQQMRSDGTPGLGSFYLTERLDAASEVKVIPRRGVDWSRVNAQVPLIVIGAGSGLAGVRSALCWRAQIAATHRAPTWCIYGERSATYDRPCDSELLNWQRDGTLQRLDRVWSASQGPLRYAQDVLHQHADLLRQYLLQGGYIYVCGNAQGLGQSVDLALHDLVGSTTMQVLTNQGRYLRDIY